MAIRSGMADLVTLFRAMVDDTLLEVFTSDRCQEILDGYRTDFYQHPLKVTPQQISGSVIYKVYMSSYGHLEGADSGTTAFRLYNSVGTAVDAADYTADYIRGIFTFAADTGGTAYYLDGRSFDMNRAAAAGWRERASKLAGDFDFGADGSTFKRSQWFQHCMQMAAYYERQGGMAQTFLYRGDMY